MTEEELHLGKGVCFSNLFHFLLSCSKAAVFPFLPLYFRQLGLSATQVGIIFGIKAFMWMWCSPFWTTCAKCCNKKRFLLVFSLLTLMTSTLLIALVPPENPNLPLIFCKNGINFIGNLSGNSTTDNEKNVVHTTTLKSTLFQSSTPIVTPNILPKVNHNVQPSNSNPMAGSDAGEHTTLPFGDIANKAKGTPAGWKGGHKKNEKESNTDSSGYKYDIAPSSVKESHKSNDWPENKKNEKEEMNEDDDDDIQLTSEELDMLKDLGISLEDMTYDEILKRINDLAEPYDEAHRSSTYYKPTKNYRKRYHRSMDVAKDPADTSSSSTSMSIMKLQWKKMKEQWGIPDSQEVFVLILAVVLIGEFFSAPVDKISDDCWFEYLDVIDSLERYGSHKQWMSLGLLITAPCVAGIVDHTPCMLLNALSNFTIHFFVFAGFIAFTIFTAFGYPISQKKQTLRKVRLGKGLQVLCSGIHAFGFTFTMFLAGIVHACLSNFVFWQAQDLGATQLTYGTAIAVAALSEMMMLPFGKLIINQITHEGAVALALLILAGRVLFYSYMWTPWLLVLGEAFHGLSYSLLWAAVQSYPDFRCNPFIMDRSAYTVMNVFHLGLGVGVGSVASGFIYDYAGFTLLYQGICIILALWCFIFIISQKCVQKKEKVRYAKLLQEDNNNESSDEDNTLYDDDWLEVAMNSKSPRKTHYK